MPQFPWSRMGAENWTLKLSSQVSYRSSRNENGCLSSTRFYKIKHVIPKLWNYSTKSWRKTLIDTTHTPTPTLLEYTLVKTYIKPTYGTNIVNCTQKYPPTFSVLFSLLPLTNLHINWRAWKYATTSDTASVWVVGSGVTNSKLCQ